MGGGIIGCAIGFFLAKAGVRPLILDRGKVGGEASSGAAGIRSALAPTLREAEMVSSWACLRPAAPNGFPVLGPIPGRRGLIVATGHFRNGILLAPITGKLIAELVTDGKPSVSLEPFRPDRPFPSDLPTNP